MANSTAAVRINISAGRAIAEAISVPYQSILEGSLDVPDATAGSTAVAIPFGSLAAANLLWVKNRTGQDMTLKLNDSAALQNLPDGAEILFAAEDLPSTSKLTACSLTTTGSQTGAGYIDFMVAGDPT